MRPHSLKIGISTPLVSVVSDIRAYLNASATELSGAAAKNYLMYISITARQFDISFNTLPEPTMKDGSTISISEFRPHVTTIYIAIHGSKLNAVHWSAQREVLRIPIVPVTDINATDVLPGR
jgi:hypothetical protein